MVSEANFVACLTSGKNLIVIQVKIINKTVDAIVDSGSTLSFINPELVKNLDLNENIEENVSVKFLDQTLAKIDKTVVVNVELDNKIITHKFYLFERMKYSMILGLDFLKVSGITIQFTDSVQRINQQLNVKLE